MIDEKIHVAIRSYKRASRVHTLALFPFAWVYCPESQADEYREHCKDRVIAIPDEEDGNAARKCNAVLNRSPCPWTLMLDDDIYGLRYYEDGECYWMKPDEIEEMICHHFLLAEELGVRLWGVNQNQDPMLYRVYKPFSFLTPLLGPFNGHLEPELRYDEGLPKGDKEDYDFWLQNIQRYHKTLRVNKYHYLHDHGTAKGGFVSMRTKQVELDSAEYMKKKWGSDIFSMGGSMGTRVKNKDRERNILNSKIRVPIKGA